jgi:hypothetical protein
MTKREICLFTAHSPLSGGGSTILRSLVAGLPELSVSWYYTGDKAVAGYEKTYLAKALMGGNLVKDIWQTWKMLTDRKTALINEVVAKLMNVDCDAYWIVSHNEGLRIALELTRKQSRPVHLTVHDDWAGALCARSTRYRFTAAPAKKLTITALKVVTSFDVVSLGMANYYDDLSGVKAEVCHRYLSADAISLKNINTKTDQPVIVAGHIGSIYSKADFIVFLSTFYEFAIAKGKKPLMKMWGCHLTMNDIPAELRDGIIFYDTLPEEKVIPELYNCAFVYAMYPFNKALRIFSQTSLPTKLTTYLQAGRPILGHGPADSTLATFLSANNLGVMWSSMDKANGLKLFEQVLSLIPGFENINNARNQYFGEENLAVMRRALLNS